MASLITRAGLFVFAGNWNSSFAELYCAMCLKNYSVFLAVVNNMEFVQLV